MKLSLSRALLVFAGLAVCAPAYAQHYTQWSAPVYFYADGTTSDASLLIEGVEDDRLRVTLRGTTGVSRVGPPNPSD